jgi:hypothetical protein
MDGWEDEMIIKSEFPFQISNADIMEVHGNKGKPVLISECRILIVYRKQILSLGCHTVHTNRT